MTWFSVDNNLHKDIKSVSSQSQTYHWCTVSLSIIRFLSMVCLLDEKKLKWTNCTACIATCNCKSMTKEGVHVQLLFRQGHNSAFQHELRTIFSTTGLNTTLYFFLTRLNTNLNLKQNESEVCSDELDIGTVVVCTTVGSTNIWRETMSKINKDNFQ